MTDRVIKFRAIHPPTGELREICEFVLDDNHGSQEIRFSCDEVWYPAKNVEQFTGLLDKNGKEIYEGARLAPMSNDYIPEYKGEWIVSFNKGAFVLNAINGDEQVWIPYFDEGHMEIIGTIHDKAAS